MRRALWIVMPIALVGLLLAPFVFTPSDRDLVAYSIGEAVVASREGRSGNVLEYLSHSLTYNELPVEDRQAVANFIRQSKPDLEIVNPEPTFEGDRAVIQSSVVVRVRVGPLPVSQTIEGVRLVLKKETGTRWLIFPAPRWRIVDVSAPGVSPESY